MSVKREKGYTLIEMVLVILLTGIIGSLIASVFMQGVQIYAGVDQRQEAGQRAGMAVGRMGQEIRGIGRTGTGEPDIQIFTATAFEFKDLGGNSIRFEQAGTNLNRNTDLLTSNVRSLMFAYLKKDGNTATVVSDIWRIQVDLEIEVGSERVRLRSEIFPRNL